MRKRILTSELSHHLGGRSLPISHLTCNPIPSAHLPYRISRVPLVFSHDLEPFSSLKLVNSSDQLEKLDAQVQDTILCGAGKLWAIWFWVPELGPVCSCLNLIVDEWRHLEIKDRIADDWSSPLCSPSSRLKFTRQAAHSRTGEINWCWEGQAHCFHFLAYRNLRATFLVRYQLDQRAN